MGRATLLSVVIPVFNERATVLEVLARALAVEIPIEREIVIVDDGSTDGTSELLDDSEHPSLSDPRVRVLHHLENRGKGAAVRTGIADARGDAILIQDADLEYDPEDWARLLRPLLSGRAVAVYGSRFTGERRNMLPSHWVGNRILSLTTNILYRSTVSDMETCYKLLHRSVLDGVPLVSNGFEIEAELTAKILRQGIRIYEVPISYAGRELWEGKKITWRDGFTAVLTLLRYASWRKRGTT